MVDEPEVIVGRRGKVLIGRVIGNQQVYFADETDIDCVFCIKKNRYA
jgi:hypothetical protein